MKLSLVFHVPTTDPGYPGLGLHGQYCPVGWNAIKIVSRTCRNTFHMPTVRSQQVSVGIVNEMDFDLDIHYQWWDEPIRPTHIRT